MRYSVSVLLACAITSYAQQSTWYGLDTPGTYRPRVSEILSLLESRGQVTWEDHELGNGVREAFYTMQDWRDAKQHLTEIASQYGPATSFDYSNDTMNSLEARAPLPSGLFSVEPSASFSVLASSLPIGSESALSASSVPSVASGSPISSAPNVGSTPVSSSIPVDASSGQPGVISSMDYSHSVDALATATQTTGASGTSSVPMADNTNHVTKWVCEGPFNVPFNLGESAVAAIICQYIFPFFQKKATGNQETVTQRTLAIPQQANLRRPGTFASVLIHVEKNGLWPALKTIFCSGLITQTVNNAYCWGYGKLFSTDPSVQGYSPQRLDGATVGGTIWIYATDGVTPIGLFQTDVISS